jgi:hypothetical protein
MSTNSTTTKPDLVADLGEAHERLERARERVAEFGEDELAELASVYRAFTDLLDRYEDDVTDDGGDFETNVQFQSEIAEIVKDVSDDMLLSETFEECDDALQKKWFHESDFEHVRKQLEPAGDLVARLDERDEARREYGEARRNLDRRVRDLDERIADLERLERLGNADLDAPTERLREPFEAYNEAVTDAFRKFRNERSAREVIDFLDEMRAFPLVEFDPPDDRLRSYLSEQPPGEETMGTLLEYADYSQSKLDHYVEDPAKLNHVVGGRQTYLDGLDAEPLCIGWPPPTATELERRCRELTSAVNRFAPDVVEQLRAVKALPRETDYDRLRDSALARESLTDEERAHITEGNVEAELADARELRESLAQTLDEYPEL